VVPVDTAVSLGLIVNELITNSVKHAFPGSHEGRIVVRLTARESEFELEVADNGVGKLRGNESEPLTHGLGLGIVDLLIEQIGAELEECEAPGVGYRIRLRQESPPSFASD
jgi:two-component sensor histidine kinase